MKVGTSVVVASRVGIFAAYNEINKFFAISGMLIASSQYLNVIYVRASGYVQEDLEGLQTMHVITRKFFI